MTNTLSHGLVVQLEAKPGMEKELSDFLTNAATLAEAEAGTKVWFALQTAESTFWIVDAFQSDDDRSAHMSGEITKALSKKGGELLAASPVVLAADVLASKVVA